MSGTNQTYTDTDTAMPSVTHEATPPSNGADIHEKAAASPYVKNNARTQMSRVREACFRIILIFIGAVIYTAGLDLFLVPNNTIDGGVTGLSLMAASLTGIPFGFFFVLINAPFLYLGYKQIGRSFTMATMLAVIIVSVLSEYIKDLPPITTDPFLSAVFGGIILGIGVGLNPL